MWSAAFFFMFVPVRKEERDFEDFKCHLSYLMKTISTAMISCRIKKQQILSPHSTKCSTSIGVDRLLVIQKPSSFLNSIDDLINLCYLVVTRHIVYTNRRTVLSLLYFLMLFVEHIQCSPYTNNSNYAENSNNIIKGQLPSSIVTKTKQLHLADNHAGIEDRQSSSHLCPSYKANKKHKRIPVFPDDDFHLCTSTFIQPTTSHIRPSANITTRNNELGDVSMKASDINIEASFHLVRNVRAIKNEPDNIMTSINMEPPENEGIVESINSTLLSSTQIAYTSEYYVSTTILPTFPANTTRIFLTLEEIARQQFEMLTGFVSYALENFTVECIPDPAFEFINCTINSTHTIKNCTDTVLDDPNQYNSTLNGTLGNNTYARLTQLWYDATHPNERLDNYASSINYCFEHGWCSNTTVYFDSVINLPDIWKAIVAPVEQLIKTMATEFNVSTEATRFGGGNTTGCQPEMTSQACNDDLQLFPVATQVNLGDENDAGKFEILGFTRYTDPQEVVDDWWGDEDEEEEGDGCEPIDKYMISLWELWYEFAKPAYFMFDVLMDLNVNVVNTTVNCSLFHNLTELGYNHTRVNYTLTMEDYYYIHMNNSMNELEQFRANFCSWEPDYSGFNITLLSYYNFSIDLYNMSMNGTLNVTVPPPPPCILVVPDTCHKVRHDNESFMEMLHRHELNWTNPDIQISANCSAYDIQGFENLTFYEMWDEMRQPRDHVLNILKNITSVLKLITVNCTNYDHKIHENITLSKVWTQFESTRRDILDILDVVYYRLPNVTVTCYDYPYNITIEPGLTPPWWYNPLIWFSAGGSLCFITFIVVWVRVCIYCQKYCETYIPGSEEKAKLEALYARHARTYLRRKHWQEHLRSKGLPDPNRSPQRKRKKLVRKLTEAEKKREWILKHMDNIPSVILENPYAVEG